MYNGLKEYLENKGFTQLRMAGMLGVSPAYVNAVLVGSKTLGKKNAKKWANLFGLSETYLLTGIGEPGGKITANDQITVSNLPDSRNQSKEKIDQSSLVNAVIAAKDETINSLLRELDAKNQLIEILQQQLNDAKYRADRPVAPYGNFVDPSLIASEPDANK